MSHDPKDRALVVGMKQVAHALKHARVFIDSTEDPNECARFQWRADVVAIATMIEKELAQGGPMGTPAELDVDWFFSECGYER